MSVRETEKTSGNRRLKENRQLQSQMIDHGVKGTLEAAVVVQLGGSCAFKGGGLPVKVTVRSVARVGECGMWRGWWCRGRSKYCVHGCDVGAVMSFAF